jgi:hypothetical protein
VNGDFTVEGTGQVQNGYFSMKGKRENREKDTRKVPGKKSAGADMFGNL